MAQRALVALRSNAMRWPKTRRDWGWAMTLGGLLLVTAALITGLTTPEGAGANIGAGMVLLLSLPLLVLGLLVVVLDVQHSRRDR